MAEVIEENFSDSIENFYYDLSIHYNVSGNYKKAINFYKRVLSDEAVPEGLLSAARFTIAQLWFQLEDWDKAISAVDDLLATEDSPRPDLYILKGSALYQLKKYFLQFSRESN